MGESLIEPLHADDPRMAGPYRLGSRLGEGGMGRVFLGRSAGGRTVAVKLIRPELANAWEFRRRFAHEIEAARVVVSDYTAAVVGSGADDDIPWLATEYVPGPSLAEAVDLYGSFSITSAAALATGLTLALREVHAAGLIHRDLKPANVLLTPDGPRVIDFGISKATEGTPITQTGAVLGSPGFMSPEQASGSPIDERSDIFSLGAVLAYATSGRSPFGQGSMPAIIYRIVHEDPRLTGIAEPLRTLIAACLEKSPSARPTLHQILQSLPPADFDGWLSQGIVERIARQSSALLALDFHVPASSGTDSPRRRNGPNPTPTLHELDVALSKSSTQRNVLEKRQKITVAKTVVAGLAFSTAILGIHIWDSPSERQLAPPSQSPARLVGSAGAGSSAVTHTPLLTDIASETSESNTTGATTVESRTPTYPSADAAVGTVLCSGGWQSPGLAGWPGSADWGTRSGTLVNDGSNSGSQHAPTLLAPCVLAGGSNYDVTMTATVLEQQGTGPGFGLYVRYRAQTQGGFMVGETAGWGSCANDKLCSYVISPASNFDDTVSTARFEPGPGQHRYTVRVGYGRVRLLIDGTQIADIPDVSHDGGTESIGFWDKDVALSISAFEVIAT